MGKFKFANSEATDTFYFGEEGEEDREWIRIRSSITNKEAHDLLAKAPMGDRDMEGSFVFLERMFDKIVVAWSITTEDGEPVAPTVENLRLLDASDARPIEEKVAQQLGKLLGREVEKLEGESTT